MIVILFSNHRSFRKNKHCLFVNKYPKLGGKENFLELLFLQLTFSYIYQLSSRKSGCLALFQPFYTVLKYRKTDFRIIEDCHWS